MRVPTEQILVEIIQLEMGLDVKNVFIQNQNVKIPADDELRVTVGMIDSQIMSSRTGMESFQLPGSNPPTFQQVEVNRVQMRENMQIDIFSRTNQAILRRWEIIAALRSFRSIQTQEAEQFKIAAIPASFVNSASAEGGSQLNRFTLIFPCLVWYMKSKDLAPDSGMYYDDFNTRVDDAKTITEPEGLIEFNIKGEIIT